MLQRNLRIGAVITLVCLCAIACVLRLSSSPSIEVLEGGNLGELMSRESLVSSTASSSSAASATSSGHASSAAPSSLKSNTLLTPPVNNPGNSEDRIVSVNSPEVRQMRGGGLLPFDGASGDSSETASAFNVNLGLNDKTRGVEEVNVKPDHVNSDDSVLTVKGEPIIEGGMGHIMAPTVLPPSAKSSSQQSQSASPSIVSSSASEASQQSGSVDVFGDNVVPYSNAHTLNG